MGYDIGKIGQSAVEFMIISGFMIFILVLFIGVINLSIADKRFEEKNNIAKEVALSVQNEISLASNSYDGYYREFEVQQKIGDLNFEININGNLVYLETSDGQHAVAYPVAEVTGNILKGRNVIQKENGVVLLNQ